MDGSPTTDGTPVQENESKPAPLTSTSTKETGVAAASAKTGPAATPRAGSALRRLFWLDERVAEARRLCFSSGHAGYAEFDMARQARAGIVQIGETSENNGAVLLLERIEVLSLLRTHLQRAGLPQTGVASLSTEDWEQVRTLPRVLELWNELATAQQAALTTAFGPDAERELISLDNKNRRYLATALRKLAIGLSEPLEFEANRIGRVLFVRWARLGAAAVVMLGVGIAGYGVYKKLTAKPNIALHRPVTVSSQFPGEGLDHSLLVDGDPTNLGFHTNNGPGEWCTIDLGASKSISRVVVTNRADCCQDRANPINILVSNDGQNFRKVAERREQFDVWTADNLQANGRYVRIQHGSSGLLHLSEVEVY